MFQACKNKKIYIVDTEKISPFADFRGHEIMIYVRSESKLDDVKQCL